MNGERYTAVSNIDEELKTSSITLASTIQLSLISLIT